MNASFYALLKSAHVGCVLVSYVLFVLRGAWIVNAHPRMNERWVRVVPHVIDSLLLASAVGLVVVTAQYPGSTAWLNAKIAGVVAYILLGMAAFRWARSRRFQVTWWVLAQCVFLYVAAVALTRNPSLW